MDDQTTKENLDYRRIDENTAIVTTNTVKGVRKIKLSGFSTRNFEVVRKLSEDENNEVEKK